jgi:hypothetical protein
MIVDGPVLVNSKSMIGMIEVDMNENRALLYCSPDFMLNSKEFGEYIKIGIQTKDYESMAGNNLLICLGFMEKLAQSSNTKYKVKIDKMVELMGNRGIKLLKPIYTSPEINSGREWNLDKFVEKNILVPETSLSYTNSKGEHSIRFTNYHPQNNHVSEVESELNEEIEMSLMNYEFTPIDPYDDMTWAMWRRQEVKRIKFKKINNHVEASLANKDEDDRILYPCELGMDLNKEELEELGNMLYLKKQLSEDEEIYYDNYKNIKIRKFYEPEEESKDYNNLEHDNFDTQSSYNLMETMEASSSAPQTNTTQNTPLIYSTGNLPRRPYNNIPQQEQYSPKGKRMPIEKPVQFGTIGEGQVLNLAAHNPQRWNEIIGVWKNKIAGDYIRNFTAQDPEEMYRYLETFLGETARAFWEAYKAENEEDFRRLVSLGAILHNFGNKLQTLITGVDPNSGTLGIQQEAMLNLEQLGLYKWQYIVQFLQDYFYYTCISGNVFNQ